MNIITLSKEQITYIYNSRMVKDFPPTELRPLAKIIEPFEMGKYTGYGLVDDSDCDEILAYAFFVKMGNHYLFDYLGVSENKRSTGLGSIFLNLLKEEFKGSDSVIGEVEDPSCAESAKDGLLQERRLNFYIRNGYLDTGVRVKLFGVDYIVLEMDLGISHDIETITELYKGHYKSMLPEKLYSKYVLVK